MFDHTLSRLRRQRESDKLRDEAAAPLIEQGFTILDERPAWRDTSCVSIDYLRTADDAETTEEAITDPAQWAAHMTEEWAYFDRETGEPVDEDDVDDETRRNPNGEPDDGLRHFSTVVERTVFVPEWFCLDYQGAGLQLDTYMTSVVSGGRDRTGVGGGSVEPEDAEAQAQREAEEADVARRERRKVLVLNRLGEAAAVVRREYVNKLLARKAPPKGAATFVARCLTRDSYILAQHEGEQTAAELLGLNDSREVRKLAEGLVEGSDGRAQVITLALVLGALERRTPKDSWRNARAGISGIASHMSGTIGADSYLEFLIGCGYTPAPVEQVIAGQRDSDDVFDEAEAAKSQ
jgi:ParB family chromosome partitioning protein